MTQTWLDRQRFPRPAPSARSDRLPWNSSGGRTSQYRLPVVALSREPRRRPVGLVPQGSDGSVLISFAPAPIAPRNGRDEIALLFFEAGGREWNEVRICRERGARESRSRLSMEPVGWPVLQGMVHAEVPGSFDVPADHGDHPATPNSARRLTLGELEVDPLSGFFSLTDAEGYRSSVVRLRSKRPRRRSEVERSLVLEILRSKGTAECVPPGVRHTAEWVPVASLESNEHWLFVAIEMHGVSFGLR